MKKTVAIIYGGEGKERKVSIASANNLSRLIDREKFNLIRVLITSTGEWFIEKSGKRCPTFPIFINGKSGFHQNDTVIKVDAAIPCLHGDMGEDGIIAGALRAAHISYVGADTLAGAACADKIITKAVADSLGIPTAKWTFATDRESTASVQRRAEESFGYPMFIKPANAGSSIGITKVCDATEFAVAYRRALLCDKRVLIEEAIPVSSELECAYFELGGTAHFSVGSICTNGKFYDFSEKYASESDIKTTPSCVADEKTRDAVIEMSRRLRSLFSVNGLGRFDYFITKDSALYFNEINTFPGMTPTSLYPALTLNMGLFEGEFINLLLSEAIYDRRF